jgi:hypothetical protein
VRDVYEVLREKEKRLLKVRREVEALRLTAQLVAEQEESPVDIASSGDDLDTTDAEGAGAGKVSMRLRRIAAPLLATFAR